MRTNVKQQELINLISEQFDINRGEDINEYSLKSIRDGVINTVINYLKITNQSISQVVIGNNNIQIGNQTIKKNRKLVEY